VEILFAYRNGFSKDARVIFYLWKAGNGMDAWLCEFPIVICPVFTRRKMFERFPHELTLLFLHQKHREQRLLVCAIVTLIDLETGYLCLAFLEFESRFWLSNPWQDTFDQLNISSPNFKLYK
jgi:hypothetical protein